MEKLGQKLLEKHVISEAQLKEALEKQRLNGGRLGDNIVALGYLSKNELNSFFKKHPTPPAKTKDTGLEPNFIVDLLLKHATYKGAFTLGEMSESIKLPINILSGAIEKLRKDHLIEVKGASQFAQESYTFQITEQGKKVGSELLEICRYTGAAPVTLEDYNSMVECQTIKHIAIAEKDVREAFSNIVIDDLTLRRMGPAISSGKAIFLYGPPGNGKTTIAEIMGGLLPETIYIPHSIIVGGQVISVFDPVSHIPTEKEDSDIDKRWISIKRPVIMTGGELTLKMLDLEFNPHSKFYEAPLQIKANNGLFIIDDFGRQQIPPQDLINRWVVPLERRVDFFSLHTGMKFDVPFDMLVIFSTNLEPKKIVDEAFLRRIRYKIKIDYPTEPEFEKIFHRVCEANAIEFNKDAFDYLINHYYKRLDFNPSSCHPRDLMDHIIDHAHHFNHEPRLTREEIDIAWENYFVEI